MGARVLLVGMGGREHAIAWKLRQSSDVDEIYIAPGNAGTAQEGINLQILPTDIEGILEAAQKYSIDFYLASMDDPQPLGLVNRLTEYGIPCYGPSQEASQLESSKAWAKNFMVAEGIPTPAHKSFENYDVAIEYLNSQPDGALVVKASGLAAGKGVIICDNHADARQALGTIMLEKKFGDSGSTVVLEERIFGWETSAHAFCDGTRALFAPTVSDYKRALDNDLGLNTGGMGVYSPSTGVTERTMKEIREKVVNPTLEGMSRRKTPYKGTLYPGLIMSRKQNSPEEVMQVLEFNARFGDPETQVLMVRLKSDLFTICRNAVDSLENTTIDWSSRPAVGVVIASGGYPESYTTGHAINGLEDIDQGVQVFHAGTKQEGNKIVTSGGRVLTVVADGKNLEEARKRVYDNIKRIKFKGSFFRKDIATMEAQS